MLKTKKLISLAERELIELKNTIPLIVLQSSSFVANHSLYSTVFGQYNSPYAIYIKNRIATPYSYYMGKYERCRARYFTQDNVSSLEYYFRNTTEEKRMEIIDYLKGNIDKISL